MLALVPARGGSKRLPGKNLRELGGIPLLAHTLQQIRSCEIFHPIVVSTDCPEIARIAKLWGAEVPFLRPDRLSDDMASSLDVFLHALSFFQEKGQDVSELLVFQPTSPFRLRREILEAYQRFQQPGVDSLVSCRLAGPANWLCQLTEKGHLQRFNTDPKAPTLYVPNGSMYFMRSALLQSHKTYWSDQTVGFPMPALRSQDIDTYEDFEMAQALWPTFQAMADYPLHPERS